jgi:hypothetical protein
MAKQVRLDRQWAFDTALTGLRAQGRKSVSGEDCLYRGPDGAKCGIGFLIPDERYSPELDTRCPNGASVAVVANAVMPGLGWGPEVWEDLRGDRAFLSQMQRRLHDQLGDDLSGLELAAAVFAESWGLAYTAPEQVPA